MKKNAISKITYLLDSILFFIVGLTLIIFRARYLNIFHLLTSLLFILLGAITFITNIIKTRKPKDILVSLLTLEIGIFFLNNKNRFLSIFPFIFGLYMLLNGVIKLITYIIFKNRENRNYYNVLIGSLIDFIFSYIMISSPSKNIDGLTIILGIYLILFGFTYFYDFLKETFPQKFGSKRRVRLTLPIILASLIPYEVLLSLNKIIENWKTPILISNKDTSGNIDLEILIHVNKTNIGKFGHADFVYKDIVYSYGCYDEESKKIFESLGNGTLFEIKGKEKYIKFCTNESDKTIFCFGISLTNEEKLKIENKIKEIKEYTYPWNPSKNKTKKENKYANKLVKMANAKFYKFNKGSSFKTYFLLSTNCVKLVDEILGVTGSDILKINGVITPGTYYDYLEREFKRKRSNVISKEIYSNEKKNSQVKK